MHITICLTDPHLSSPLETECRIAIALVMPPPWQNLTHKANQQNSKLDPGINAGENTEMRKTKPNLTRARKIVVRNGLPRLSWPTLACAHNDEMQHFITTDAGASSAISHAFVFYDPPVGYKRKSCTNQHQDSASHETTRWQATQTRHPHFLMYCLQST